MELARLQIYRFASQFLVIIKACSEVENCLDWLIARNNERYLFYKNTWFLIQNIPDWFYVQALSLEQEEEKEMKGYKELMREMIKNSYKEQWSFPIVLI